MSHALPGWLPSVVADLRAVSVDLLEPGATPSVPTGTVGAHGWLLRNWLTLADEFAALTPRLLTELEWSATESSGDWRSTPIPRGARPSRAPQDHWMSNGVALPLRWLRLDTEPRPDAVALRWALGVCERLQEQLHTHSLRLERRLDEALLVRSGESHWAQQDAQTLRALAQSVQQRIVSMRQAQATIRAHAGQRIHSSERAPIPYPQQPAWRRLRRLASDLVNPSARLATVLNGFLTQPSALADVPFLYQRWCGLQLVQSFERLGWARHGDLTGALFLGGRLALWSPESGPLTIWMEPRISQATVSLTGWACAAAGDELTPDFLITCGEVGMRDAFVLDATIATSDGVLNAKSKYRFGIVGADTLRVAGVPTVRRPLRAWAVAPLDSTTVCRLNDPDGRTGCIPLHPGRRDHRALDAWVADVSLHAKRQRVRQRVSPREVNAMTAPC